MVNQNPSSSELDSLKNFFSSISFSQPLTVGLIDSTIGAIESNLRGDLLRSQLASSIPCQAFVFQEVISVKDFYQKYCRLLNICDVETPSTRSLKDMLVLRILVTLHGDDDADKTFALFRENRKALKQTDVSDPELYDINPPMTRAQNHSDHTAESAPKIVIGNSSHSILPSLNNLPAEKLRELLSLILADSSTNPTQTATHAKGNINTSNHDDDANSTTYNESRFRLEVALARIQSYYTKAQKYSGEFEDDLDDIFTEFDTACRGQMAPDSAKSELFRLAITGRALTFYKTINGSCIAWDELRKRFMNQFMSRTKKAEISAELDTLHISTLRTAGDTDRQALDKLISRLDKLSLMGNEDDKKDDAKIRRLHNAIAQETWTYFALCKLPVVYGYEEMVSILRKSITDLTAFERLRKKASSSVPNDTKPTPWTDPGSSKPPPLDELLAQVNAASEVRRTCFNCEREGCLLGRCKEPLNTKRIAENLEKFKKEKAARTKNNKWSAKRINLADLQPIPDEWIDVYETIVCEQIVNQYNNSAPDVSCTSAKAFSGIYSNTACQNAQPTDYRSAFQEVIQGECETKPTDAQFSSLFDVMTTPPSMSRNDSDECF